MKTILHVIRPEDRLRHQPRIQHICGYTVITVSTRKQMMSIIPGIVVLAPGLGWEIREHAILRQSGLLARDKEIYDEEGSIPNYNR